MSLVRHEVQQVTNAVALAALTIVPTNNDEVHVEELNRRFNWLEGSVTVADNLYVIEQTSESANGRWAATAVEGAKVFTGSGSTGAIPNGNTAVFSVTVTGSGTLAANSGAALGITNGASFPANVFLDSIVLIADNTVQLTVVNESGNDVVGFNIAVKAIDFTGVAQAAAVVANPPQFGSVPVTTMSYQSIPVTFATPFPAGNIPFVTLTSHVREDLLQWTALNVTNTGFTLEGYGMGTNNFAGNIGYKVEKTPTQTGFTAHGG